MGFGQQGLRTRYSMDDTLRQPVELLPTHLWLCSAPNARPRWPPIDRATGYQFELEAYNRLVGTEDRMEGVRAFNEKRKPDFKGK